MPLILLIFRAPFTLLPPLADFATLMPRRFAMMLTRAATRCFSRCRHADSAAPCQMMSCATPDIRFDAAAGVIVAISATLLPALHAVFSLFFALLFCRLPLPCHADAAAHITLLFFRHAAHATPLPDATVADVIFAADAAMPPRFSLPRGTLRRSAAAREVALRGACARRMRQTCRVSQRVMRIVQQRAAEVAAIRYAGIRYAASCARQHTV